MGAQRRTENSMCDQMGVQHLSKVNSTHYSFTSHLAYDELVAVFIQQLGGASRRSCVHHAAICGLWAGRSVYAVLYAVVYAVLGFRSGHQPRPSKAKSVMRNGCSMLHARATSLTRRGRKISGLIIWPECLREVGRTGAIGMNLSSEAHVALHARSLGSSMAHGAAQARHVAVETGMYDMCPLDVLPFHWHLQRAELATCLKHGHVSRGRTNN